MWFSSYHPITTPIIFIVLNCPFNEWNIFSRYHLWLVTAQNGFLMRLELESRNTQDSLSNAFTSAWISTGPEEGVKPIALMSPKKWS